MVLVLGAEFLYFVQALPQVLVLSSQPLLLVVLLPELVLELVVYKVGGGGGVQAAREVQDLFVGVLELPPEIIYLVPAVSFYFLEVLLKQVAFSFELSLSPLSPLKVFLAPSHELVLEVCDRPGHRLL